jgi:signal transduction histidine kinase
VPAYNRSAESLPRYSGPRVNTERGLTADRFQIMSNLSHELRTPLQVLNGYLDILSEDWADQFGDEPLRILERLRTNTGELTQTIENLLEYTAILTRTQATAIEPLEIADLVGDLQAGFAAAAERKKIALRWRIQPDLTRMHSDRRLLRSITSNLLSNAIKFTEAGNVTVRLRRLRSQSTCTVELEVADTGIGIDGRRLGDAFEPFVQLSSTSARKHRGLGLGLALVLINVKTLGATMEVRSNPAFGSRFKVRFPQQGAMV